MKYAFGRFSWQKRCSGGDKVSKSSQKSTQTARVSNPLWQCIRPLTVCFVGSSNRKTPSDSKASDGPTALSASSSAEAVLVPQYEGPITNPHSGSHQSVPDGVILVEPSPVNCPATNEPDTPDSPDYAAALAQALANLCRRASEENRVQPAQQAVSFQNNSSQVGTGSSKSAEDAAETISDDLTAMVDSLVSCEAQHAAVDQVLDHLLAEVAAPLQPVQRSMPADISGVSPMVSPRVSLPANLFAPQHAAVDPVLDRLLAEVAAPLQPVQSSTPADTSGVKPMISPRVSPRVSLPANLFAPQHAEVDQVLDDLLAEVSAPLQPVQSSMPAGSSEATLKVSLPSDKGSAEQMLASMPPTPAPDNLNTRASNRSPPLLAQLSSSSSKPLAVAKELAGTPGQPAGTAAKPVLAEIQLLVPSSSSSNKENDPLLEAVLPSKVRQQTADKAGDGSMVISRGGCLDRRTFQEMAQALPTEPSSQVRWMREKIADLGHGPAHVTTLTSLPPPSSALPTVLRLSTGNKDWASEECNSLAMEAMLMWQCVHPNVVPITLLGLKSPATPLTPLDPHQVAYFGMPMADLSLEKRMGQQVWGKRGGVGNKYRGPSLATLVQHGKAVLKPLAHIYRSRVLHRGLTPDHVLLFSKGGQEADSGMKAATKPAAIKHDVKLAGFGAAARLTGQGCAIQPSPYRCGVVYVPPEAEQGAALTTAADIYQFGGLCYYMATGLHPPLLADATPLPDYVPEQWRLMVSLCRAAKPVDRPTLAQLQLHLHGLCQPAPTPMQLPAKSAPAVPVWVPPHARSQELSAFALSQKGLQCLRGCYLRAICGAAQDGSQPTVLAEHRFSSDKDC